MKSSSTMAGLLLRILPCLLGGLAAYAEAAPSPRPMTGIGVLAVFPPHPARSDAPAVPVYEEPGVARAATAILGDLPHIASAVQDKGDVSYLAVNEKRGVWFNISYDDAGRSGWIRSERSWTFSAWPDFLKGRAVKLLPGLRKNLYSLLGSSGDNGELVTRLTASSQLRVVKVVDDWCFVIALGEGSGWVRWRDGDGRFLISVDPRFDPQKH